MRRRLSVCAGAATLGLTAGCFKAPVEKAADTAHEVDSAPGADTLAEVSPDGVEADGELPDTAPDPDVHDVRDAIDSTEPGDADVGESCGVDADCASLASPPCRTARCDDGRCVVTDLAVACDDGDACTTADKCVGGSCQGRPFNESEAASWHLDLGGTGEDAAFSVAAHPSGDALVVGGFTGTLELPTGSSLVAEGETPDAFFLRLSPQGAILRAVRFGGPEADVGVHVRVVDETGQVALAWNTLSADQTKSATLVWLNDNGSVRHTSTLPGHVVSFDLRPDASAGVLLTYDGPIDLPAVGGGTLTLPGGPRSLALLRTTQDGVAWARAFVSEGAVFGTDLVELDDRARVVILATADWRLGASGGGAGTQLVDVAPDGTFLATEATPGAETVAWLRRGTRAESVTSTWESGDGVESLQCVIGRRESDSCEARFVAIGSPDLTAAAWGIGAPITGGRSLVHGLVRGTFELAPGVAVSEFEAPGFWAILDDRCAVAAVGPNPFASGDDPPPRLRWAVQPELRSLHGDATELRGGALILVGNTEVSLDLGATFDHTIINPKGGGDAVIGLIAAPTVAGCAGSEP